MNMAEWLVLSASDSRADARGPNGFLFPIADLVISPTAALLAAYGPREPLTIRGCVMMTRDHAAAAQSAVQATTAIAAYLGEAGRDVDPAELRSWVTGALRTLGATVERAALSANGRAALVHAGRGWAVFPVHTPRIDGGCSCGTPSCPRVGKHPRTPHGLRDATTDPGTILAWWWRWPEANIGVALGQRSGIVAVAVDPRHGGDETLAALEREHGAELESVEAVTGGGGRHIVFACPAGGCPTRYPGEGLELRGDGAYIVVVPSLHASGRTYTWEVSHDPDDVALAPLPDWLLAIAHGAPSGRPASQSRLEPRRVLEGVSAGERDTTLFRYACRLRGKGLAREEAEILVVQAARACQPPFPDQDARAKVASAWKYPSGDEDRDERRATVDGEPLSRGSGADGTTDTVPSRLTAGGSHASQSSEAAGAAATERERPPTAAQIAAEGGDPFGDAAIARVFTAQAIGRRGGEGKVTGTGADFTDFTLAHSVMRYFAGIYTQGRFLVFLLHSYRVLEDAELEQFLTAVIARQVDPLRATARRVAEVRKLIAVVAHRPDAWTNQTFNSGEVVVFQNGVLELPALTFRAGRPEDYMTMQVQCEWRPEVPPGAIDAFVASLLKPDDVLPFLQFVGYAMVPGAPSQEKYAILLGVGENGKSRLLLVLAALFDGFTVSIPLQDLAQNRFEKGHLYGKMVNLVGDMSAGLIEDTSVLKLLTGGDRIHADVKFKDPIEFVNRAKAIISANELFRVHDHTWGFYRRAMIFAFARDFREGGRDGARRDPAIVEKLLADPDTLPRLAYLGVQAYLRLRQAGRFAEPETMIAAREAFRLANDPVAAFVAEVLTEDSGHDLPKEELYRAFALWARATGRGAVSAAKFWQRWAHAAPAYADMTRARVGERRMYVVRNVGLDPTCLIMVDGREGQAISLVETLGREERRHTLLSGV